MAHALLPRIEDLAKKLLWVPCEPSSDLRLQEDLEELQGMTRRIQAVLNDAEKTEICNESVSLWLKELKVVVYDAEDVLDKYNYELLRAMVEAGIRGDAATHLPLERRHQGVSVSTTASIRLDGSFFGKRVENLRKIWSERRHQEVSESSITSIPLDGSLCCKIADDIRKIRAKFEKVSKDHASLHLREGDGQRQPLVIADPPPSSHIVDDQKIYGRRDDLEKVINQLLYSDESEKSNLSVVPIVGMGGVGKTTLVQHVYNDPRICDYFQMKGWVCVSDDFKVEKLTSRIIESLTKHKCYFEEFSALQEKLKELLHGKRFLLVLDDVWNEKQGLWESLQRPLTFGAQGSAVVTTTRNEYVAKIMQTMPFHRLGCLSIDDCWEIFIKSAFVDGVPDDCQDLMEIGKKIVRKCGGLPLAAKSLGGLLCYETDADVWEEVLQSNTWDLGDGIIPALRLSYLHLPSYLKQCFLYASIFPKDFIFRKNQIVLLWMAHGFLQCKGSKQAEDVGNMYFRELVQRSAFQCYPGFHDEEDPCFVIHDLLHDLAQHISGGEFFQMEGDEAHVPCPNVVRHLSVVNQKAEDVEKMLRAPRAIRTLVVRVSRADLKFPSQMMLRLQSLRAVDLRCSKIDELPYSTGNLKHLRYLNLDYTDIVRLPDSVCKLYNLQTLSLLYCRHLTSLPKDVKNLLNLRCLKIEGSNIQFLPTDFGKLTSLRALDEYILGSNVTRWTLNKDSSMTEEKFNSLSLPHPQVECCGIEELKDMIHLRGRLQISNLQKVTSEEDVLIADLRSKENIKELVLVWKDDQYTSPSVQERVLSYFRPPDRLKVLSIYGYAGLRLPSWFGDDPSSLSKLVRVVIESCKCCMPLPPLGQLPSLKHLTIKSMGWLETVGPEFRGHASVGFPALEELHFSLLTGWETWEPAIVKGDFPCLRCLIVNYCPELKSMVPLYLLPALEELHVWDCPSLPSIELWSSPPSPRAPPLKKMTIVKCPRARFLPEDNDDEHLLLPPTLRHLNISGSCPRLVEWCERGGGSRLAHVPNAKLWRKRNGKKVVSTSEPEVDDGALLLKLSAHPSSYGEVKVRPQDDEEGDDGSRSPATRSPTTSTFHDVF